MRFQVCPSRAYNSCAVRASLPLPTRSPAAPRPAVDRARPSRAHAPPTIVVHRAKPCIDGFARSQTAMVDPQSAARPATACSFGSFLCCCSCRRPPFRRRAPRAGQQRNLLARWHPTLYTPHYSLHVGPPWWIRRARRAPPQCAAPGVFCAAVCAAGRRSAGVRVPRWSAEKLARMASYTPLGSPSLFNPPRRRHRLDLPYSTTINGRGALLT